MLRLEIFYCSNASLFHAIYKLKRTMTIIYRVLNICEHWASELHALSKLVPLQMLCMHRFYLHFQFTGVKSGVWRFYNLDSIDGKWLNWDLNQCLSTQ